ncbi:MAG: FAD binding domain-containing protein [Acidimicrobiales bacterium]
MIPTTFSYERAESIDHAIELLGAHEDAKLLAGGHSLLPLMKLRLARPAVLIDLGRVGGMSGVRDAGDHIVVGALTRHHDLNNDAVARQACPLLAHTAGMVGDPQVRHRGTIGGSVAHGDPASDLPTVCLALDASFVLRGPRGERTVAARDFFIGFFETALAPDEILTEIRVPKHDGVGWSYLKFCRRSIDWATVGVAAVVSARNGTVVDAKIALTNMGLTPLRASAVEAALAGAPRDAVNAAAERADDGTDPPADTWGSADYRRHLARILVGRAVEESLGR